MSDLAFQPVIIIGAARSGTNALRDMMTALPGMATWPCDEINPIWRHGNLRHPDDAIPPGKASPSIRRFIRRAFTRIWREQGKPPVIVEKTCANALRIPFVDAVLPEAKYIAITRDGVDVVASAQKRWRGELEFPGLPYFLAKARYAPLRDLPAYGLSFLRARLGMLRGTSRRLSVWGPRFPGMDALENPSLELLCARQWAACVEASDAGLRAIDPDRVLRLSYEGFVADPRGTLKTILAFLGQSAPDEEIEKAAASVRGGSVGKGRRQALPADALDAMAGALAAHGYRRT